MDLHRIGEFGLIREITQNFLYYEDPEVIKGIGDDAAVTLIDRDRCLLSSVDTLVEGVHFSLAYTPPSILGRRCVSVSVSDIAAMGGTPRYLLLSLGIPSRRDIDLAFLKALYRGVGEAMETYGMRLIGGNVASSPERLVLAATILGEVRKDRVVLREGARPGDRIYVTGTIGDAALGLRLLQRGIRDGRYHQAIKKHLEPVARLSEGRRLADEGLVTAMIDISDGLLADLSHIMEGSGLGARIYLSRLPLSEDFISYLTDHPKEMDLALRGGEDYELLFTAPPSVDRRIGEIALEMGCQITCIGEMVKERELIVVGEDGRPLSISIKGFDHLREDGR